MGKNNRIVAKKHKFSYQTFHYLNSKSPKGVGKMKIWYMAMFLDFTFLKGVVLEIWQCDSCFTLGFPNVFHKIDGDEDFHSECYKTHQCCQTHSDCCSPWVKHWVHGCRCCLRQKRRWIPWTSFPQTRVWRRSQRTQCWWLRQWDLVMMLGLGLGHLVDTQVGTWNYWFPPVNAPRACQY